MHMTHEMYAKAVLSSVALWIMLPLIVIAHFYVGWLKGVLFALGMGALVIYVLPFWMMVGFIPLVPLERWEKSKQLRTFLGPAISWALAMWIGWWLLPKIGVAALRPLYLWTTVVLGVAAIWDAARTPL